MLFANVQSAFSSLTLLYQLFNISYVAKLTLPQSLYNTRHTKFDTWYLIVATLTVKSINMLKILNSYCTYWKGSTDHIFLHKNVG